MMQGRFADGDRLAARLGMARGILHRGLDQHARRALAQRASREIVGQLEVEVIGAVGIRLALHRPGLEHARHPCRMPFTVISAPSTGLPKK